MNETQIKDTKTKTYKNSMQGNITRDYKIERAKKAQIESLMTLTGIAVVLHRK